MKKSLPIKPKLIENLKSFGEHLSELRYRFFISFFVFLVASCFIYPFSSALLSWLLKPLHQSVYYTSPVGGFNLVLQVCLLFGFLFSLPCLIYHLFRFIEPTLPKHSKKLIIISLLSSLFLMTIGVCFAYFISLPAAFHFLGEFGSNQVHSLITTSEYFAFVTHYLLGFGLLFQLPLVLLFINYISPLAIKNLLDKSRYVIVICAIIAAILTPTPDPVNMAIMAIPLILLFYVSVLLIFLVNKRKKLDNSPRFSVR